MSEKRSVRFADVRTPIKSASVGSGIASTTAMSAANAALASTSGSASGQHQRTPDDTQSTASTTSRQSRHVTPHEFMPELTLLELRTRWRKRERRAQ